MPCCVDADVAWATLRTRRVPIALAALLAITVIALIWITRAPDRLATTTAMRPTPADMDMIAMLPFRDLSADQSLAMLADGFANHLRDNIYGAVYLVNRADTLAWRGDHGDLAAAARGLGASLVVGGDLDWRNGRLHATVRLYDARESMFVLERSFERPPADHAPLLEDLTAAVALAVGDRPGVWRHDPHSGRGTSNPEAWQAFLHVSTRYAGGRAPNSQRRAGAGRNTGSELR